MVELFFYQYPKQEELKSVGTKSIYLGFYHWWDGHRNYELAQTYGFTGRRAGPLSGNIIAYDNIDEKLCEVHNWLKFLGLEEESIIKGYGKNGEDFVNFAYVRPPQSKPGTVKWHSPGVVT